MATFTPTGLTYVSSLVAPPNSATTTFEIEWNPLFNGYFQAIAAWSPAPQAPSTAENTTFSLAIPMNVPNTSTVTTPAYGTVCVGPLTPIGVISGFKYTINNAITGPIEVGSQYFVAGSQVAGTKVYVTVTPDPFATYKIQASAPAGLLKSQWFGAYATLMTPANGSATGPAAPWNGNGFLFPQGSPTTTGARVPIGVSNLGLNGQATALYSTIYNPVATNPTTSTAAQMAAVTNTGGAGNLETVQIIGMATDSAWYEGGTLTEAMKNPTVIVRLVRPEWLSNVGSAYAWRPS